MALCRLQRHRGRPLPGPSKLVERTRSVKDLHVARSSKASGSGLASRRLLADQSNVGAFGPITAPRSSALDECALAPPGPISNRNPTVDGHFGEQAQ